MKFVVNPFTYFRNSNTTKAFGRQMFLRQLPISICVALASALADMADSLFVGNSMGEIGLAAIGLSLPIFMIMNIIIQGVGVGASIRFSSVMAEGKRDEAISIYRTAISFSLISGCVIAVITNVSISPLLIFLGADPVNLGLMEAAGIYLRIISIGAPVIIVSYAINDFMRNDDLEKEAGVIAIIGNVCDFLFTILFVFTAGLGVVGAAIATVLGKLVSILLYCAVINRKSEALSSLFGSIDIISHVPQMFKTGSSSAIQYFSDMLFLLIVNNVLSRMAGAKGLAVFDLIQVVSYLMIYIYNAFVEAGQPAVSTFVGERNHLEAEAVRRRMVVMGQLAGIFMGVLAFFFADGICRVFGVRDSDTLALGIVALRIYLLGSLIMGTNIIIGGYYQASEHFEAANLISLLRSVVILFPITILLSFTDDRTFFVLYPLTEIISIVIFKLWEKKADFRKSNFDEARVGRFSIRNNEHDLADCVAWSEAFCEKWNARMNQQYYVQMSFEELISAIMKHGFVDENGMAEVTIVSEEDGDFILRIRDNAVEFNPFSLEQTTDEISEDEMDILGVKVIKNKAKEFSYRRYMGFNSLVVKI